MNKWQKQVQQSLLKSEEDVIKQLKKQYRSALSDIMAKVEQYDADIKNIDKALENTALDDNARAVLLSQRQSKIYQKQYQETLKAQISGIIDKLNADNYTAINDYLNGTYNDAFVGTVYDMANQGVPFIMPVNQAAVTNAVLVNSKISGGLYEALGVNAKKLKKRIAEEISRGIAQNMSYTDIARNLVNTSGIGINNAVRIIRTEGHRIQQTATHDAQIQAKAKGADVLKQWDASLDGKTRPLHRMLDGQIREVEEPFEADGIKVDRPGEFGIASQDINCRCACMTRARWALDEGFSKIDNFTGETVEFASPKDYADFKEKYWSKENTAYMSYVQDLETKYGTKNFEKLIVNISDDEYEKVNKLKSSSPIWKLKIRSPISQRSNAVGRPNAIAQFDVELNNKQKTLLEKLPKYNSSVIVGKNEVSMTDLSALTAKTGCEYAMFTRGSQRLIIRGNSHSVDVDIDKAKEMMQNGYRWSGHTHPGTDFNCLIASGDDYEILNAFGQKQSVAYNSVGQYMVYELE